MTIGELERRIIDLMMLYNRNVKAAAIEIAKEIGQKEVKYPVMTVSFYGETTTLEEAR